MTYKRDEGLTSSNDASGDITVRVANVLAIASRSNDPVIASIVNTDISNSISSPILLHCVVTYSIKMRC